MVESILLRSAVDIVADQIRCVPGRCLHDHPSSNAGERNVAIHTATRRQHSCERYHEGGVLGTSSILDLFNVG